MAEVLRFFFAQHGASGVTCPLSTLVSYRLGASAGLERSFCPWELISRREKGECAGKTKRGKRTKRMVVVDGNGISLGGQLASATPAEVKLNLALIEGIKVPRLGPRRSRKRPKRMIADKAYDCTVFRITMHLRGIKPIIPSRKNRVRDLFKEDGWTMRRYRKRWKVERTLAWIGSFQRLLVRGEHLITLYCGFFHLACPSLLSDSSEASHRN